ncbi:MAG: EAL domain-containing protein, partial [Spirochaetales bacterium]|nr:EAL domain-containing protein [Spirochaetales bacterium]
ISNQDIEFLKSISRKLEEKIIIGESEVLPSFTIGINMGADDIIAGADLALKKAKELKVDSIVFEKSMQLYEECLAKQTSIVKIKKCIKNKKIVSFFQPIIHLATNQILKYECLARIDSEGDLLTPDKFLEEAKQARVYYKITESMINNAFEYFKDLDLSFSINLDYDDFNNEYIVYYIINKIIEYNNAHKITFEILESMKIADPGKIINFIDIVKELGCKIAIDDFGSGYSNFNYLLDFKIDYIKIDSSLIKDIDRNLKSVKITKSIVTLAKEMNIKTIAEHVDTESILKTVKNLGIDYAQGYLFGKPERTHLEKNSCNISL